MRINFISYQRQNSIISGKANSISVIRMCESLSKNGNDVTLFCKGRYGDEKRISDHFGIKNKFNIELINTPTIPVVGSFLYIIFLFLRIFSRKKPHIFYGRSIIHLLPCIFFSVPLVYESHKIPFNLYNKIMEKFFFNLSFFHKLITISKSLKSDYLLNFQLQPSSIFVLHDGSRISKIFSKKNSKIGKLNNPKVGYIGSLYKGRGIGIIHSLSNKLPFVKFYVIGGTKSEVQLSKIRYHSKNLIFCGSVKPSEVSHYMSFFDILLAPYQKNLTISNKPNTNTSAWMSPLKVFEYMSSGIPMICSDFSVLKEVLEHKSNCLLVEPDNINEWVKNLNLLINNSELRNKISEKARADIEENYSWDKRSILFCDEISKGIKIDIK